MQDLKGESIPRLAASQAMLQIRKHFKGSFRPPIGIMGQSHKNHMTTRSKKFNGVAGVRIGAQIPFLDLSTKIIVNFLADV